MGDTIFVGGLPHTAHRDHVIARFSKFGRIKKIVWPMIHDKRLNRKRPKGFAYVIFRDNKSAEDVLKAHATGRGIFLDGFPESKLGIDRKRDNTALTAQVRARRTDLGLPQRDSSDAQRETETYVAADKKTYIKSMVFVYGQIKKIVWPQTLDKTMGVRRHKGFCYVIFFSHADSLKALAAAKANGGHLEIFDTKLCVEPKLDRPCDGEQEHGTTVPQPTPEPIGEMGFEELYRREKVKSERLQVIVHQQRHQIQRLEELVNGSETSNSGGSVIRGKWSRLKRKPSVVAIVAQSNRSSRTRVGTQHPAPRTTENPSSPIPGRWRRARMEREASKIEASIPLTTRSMPHPLMAARQVAVTKPKAVVDLRGASRDSQSAFRGFGFPRAKSLETRG